MTDITIDRWIESARVSLDELEKEVKRLRRAWQILRSKTEMSCVCFTEYPDKQDINTHELMDLALKEASE
tara:strand:+ start:19711 stop:19920 length:210 start_codon:yes stop_codon:yes gene_type:complete